MKKTLALLILNALLIGFLMACTQSGEGGSATVARPEPETGAAQESESPPQDDLAETVARMGAIGFSDGGVFSPDGESVAFVTNASGVPNVWMADADGGNLRQVTRSDDQVGGVGARHRALQRIPLEKGY